MKRTDIHRPAVINPADYQFVSMEYIKLGDGGDILADCAYLNSCRETIRQHMAKTGGHYANHEHGGSCMVCGAGAIYTALFYHPATNTYIRTGQDCAEKMGFGDADWNRFKSTVHDALKAVAGKRKAEAFLDLEGISECWAIYLSTPAWTAPYEERTIADIVGKLVQYGSISDKQVAFLKRLLAKITERADVEAKREAERAAAPDCPEGRFTVTGTVLTVRVDNTPYGPTTKMLVRADEGYKVWGTRPSGTNCDRNDRVSFTATVTRSDKDSKFGFYKRPTNAQVLERKLDNELQPVVS